MPPSPSDSLTPGWLWAEQHADLRVLLPGGVPMHFQRIPAGAAFMGGRDGDSNEEPRHRVSITDDFYLAIFPVTQAQWSALMGTTVQQMKEAPNPGGDTLGGITGLGALHPMSFVHWHDAREFALRFPAPAGWAACLPNEAQWEYACRAGTETEYASGDGETALAEAGWFDGNAGGTTHPVGGLARNARGLHDVHGNVWEWCADVWDAQAYRKREDGWSARQWTLADAGANAEYVDDEQRENNDPLRVVRGGSWDSSAWWCRSAFRLGWGPRDRYWSLGFRLCLSPVPVVEKEKEKETSQSGAEPADEAVRERGTSERKAQAAGGAGLERLRPPRRPA